MDAFMSAISSWRSTASAMSARRLSSLGWEMGMADRAMSGRRQAKPRSAIRDRFDVVFTAVSYPLTRYGILWQRDADDPRQGCELSQIPWLYPALHEAHGARDAILETLGGEHIQVLGRGARHVD